MLQRSRPSGNRIVAEKNKTSEYQNEMASKQKSAQFTGYVNPTFGDTTLHLLAKEGKLEELEQMIEMQELTLKGVDNDGRTLLHVATIANQCEMMKYLISCGNDLNAVDNNGDTALHLAVSNRHIEATQTLLSHEADDTILNKQSDAPLHIAARNDHGAIVAAMLQYPINVVVEGLRKRTPMHVAAENDSIEVVKVLHNHITSDKNKNSCFRLCAKDEDALSPIHLAARKGSHRVLECMIDCSKDHGYTAEQVLGFLDEENNTPLHTAVDGGHDEVVRVLLAHGASPIESNMNHLPPIHLACSQGKLKMVELMVQYGGADVITCRDAFGQTPLHSSTLPPSTSVLCYLVNIGAQLNVSNNQGQTPFITATLSGNLAAVKLLLKSGADPMVRDLKGENPLHYAIQRNKKAIAKCFLEHPAAPQTLIETNHSGTSPVHCALQHGFSDLVSHMLGLLEGSLYEHRDSHGNNYLHLAALGGDWKTLTAILDIPACHTFLNEINKDGSTPLHLATYGGHQRCVEILLSHGAMTHKCSCGLTPFLLACLKGHAECSKVLYEAHPFQKNWSNDEGNTALHMAALAGSPACISLALGMGVSLTYNHKQESFFDIIINRVDSESALAVIQHDRWSECLKFRSPLHPHPMVGLVSKLPEVARAVLDRCYTKSPLPRDHIDYWESYSFEHLKIDHEFWQTPLRASVESDRAIELELNAMPTNALHNVAYQTGLVSSGQPKEQQYEVLEKMAIRKQTSLLTHAVVTAYIKQKWHAYGRLVFLTSLLIAFLQVLLLSIFVSTIIPGPQQNISNTTVNISDISLDLTVITLILTTLRIIWVSLNMLLYGREVLSINKNLSLWIGGAGVISSYMFLLSAIIRGYDGVLWTAGALAVFFGWFGLALELSLFDLFGIYVVMFVHVTRTIFLVLSLCFLFLLAFGLAFYIIASGDPNFSTIGYSLFTVSGYLLGQINYGQFIVDENSGILSNPILVFILVILSAVILAIAAKNLLIGVAVKDIEKIRQVAMVHRQISHISTFTHLERAMPQCLEQKFNFIELKIYPNKKVPFLQQMWRCCWRSIKNESPVDEGGDSKGSAASHKVLSEDSLVQLEQQIDDLAAREKRMIELMEQLQ